MQISKLLGKKFNQEFNKPTNQRESSGEANLSKYTVTSPKSLKQQSAMEYLMTYGWAILIIAVVLVALFQMGVFNSSNFAPKAQPGACQVFKTTASTSLEGTCNNMLPQYVSDFNGQSSYVNLPSPMRLTGAHTISLWINPSSWSSGTYPTIFGGYFPGANFGVVLEHWSTSFVYSISNSITASTIDFPFSYLPTNSWSAVTVEWDGTSGANAMNVYVNGQLVGSGAGLTGPISWGVLFDIGVGYTPHGYFQGSLSNFQIYNTSLSANDVQAIYLEGIGGAPQNTQNLVGWWPLNGNSNDYSGNNNNGAATNVIYSGSWESAYSAP